VASVASGFVINPRRANGPPRTIGRAVANHQAYGHLASPLKVRQHVAQSLVLGHKRTRLVEIIHSAAYEDDLWDVVYLTGPSSIGGPTSCESCGVHRIAGLSSGSASGGFASPAFTFASPGRVPPTAIPGLAPKR
jgi:hypothetical protein